ncbi:RraA family protein [Fontivita pretiosa]|uniref:RraA family protein n=1 Tax=Fontivita pretiosa TaxID=2989684 RepID=UPI003D17D830
MSDSEPLNDLAALRQVLYTAVVLDALDAAGLRHQSPRVQFQPVSATGVLLGRCKTTLWADMAHEDPRPYELELVAVDTCKSGDVLIAAAGGSMRSGIWGELLSTAAKNSGCVGAIVDGAVRDVMKMRAMNFPVYARGTCPYDSMHRQRVIDIDVPVEIDGVLFSPGDLVIADIDGVAVVPQAAERDVLARALKKVRDENRTRDAIRNGMKAVEAYKTYGVL